jgi:hypothetical protein
LPKPLKRNVWSPKTTTQTFRGSYIRLSYNLKYYWDYQALATPEQVEAADAATAAIDEATAKLEILKEKMK